ncbi:MAG TPA: amidohydrolase [Flavobacterium sp.]|uniref:amidohydrolase n=1 Tax=Flavobacterium sp. TaxID=239 RepID=UPI002BB3BF85|nr:amidohydrolase [Flavobacterium sp.]HNP32865.1 amidohydrolase [Flavobacterium sp.]
MKISRFSLLLLLFCASGIYAQKSNYSTLINNAVDKIESKVIAWRHDIHENPELGNREVRTAALIAKHLQSLGIEVQTGVAVTGVIGVLKGDKPGPVVALRADMDALPVEEKNNLPYRSNVKTMYNGKETSVMHACGHDAHVAILMGVAEILSGMKKDLKGTVKFIFQPAEESAPFGEQGGAELMVKEGVLENPKVDVIFGLHMASQTEVGKINYRPGGAMAAVSTVKITVNGKPSHGAQPWSSVDPIVVSAQIINNLQTIVSRNVNITQNPVVVTIGSIHGGNRDNIISENVEMMGTVRTFTEEDKKLVYDRIRQICEKTAESAGATADVVLPYEHYYPVTFNDEKLTAEMLPTLQKSAGKENVLLVAPITGAEDFSFFQQKVPGLYFFIGGMPKGQDPKKAAPHHTPQFIIDDSAFKTGLKAMCNLVFDYIELHKK